MGYMQQMTISQKQFMALLRAGLWGKEADAELFRDGVDWKTVFSLAKQQSVLALVANVVLNDSALVETLPAGMKERLKAFVLVNLSTHSMLNNTLVQVVSTLNGSGIDSVLLKGQGIARNYPVPELRACGDIDIYVGQENYLKACDVLGAVASWREDGEPMENTKHYDIRIGKTTVEIHRFSDVNASKRLDRIYQGYSDEGLSRGLRVLDFAGTQVNTPADDFNAFYIFNHLWHHFATSGVGLRQFCDWMLFLHNHKDGIDLVKLRQIIVDMDLMRPWQAFGCVLVDVLGMPADEFPFYDASASGKVGRIMRHVFEEGNFGQERSMYGDRRGESYLYRKVKSFLLHAGRSFQLFMIFPAQVARQFGNTLRSGFAAVWKDNFKRK